MEILETGGRVAGIDLEGLGLQGSKNEFLIKLNHNYAKNNPMTFPVTDFLFLTFCEQNFFESLKSRFRVTDQDEERGKKTLIKKEPEVVADKK